jgi:hypothetical protein
MPDFPGKTSKKYQADESKLLLDFEHCQVLARKKQSRSNGEGNGDIFLLIANDVKTNQPRQFKRCGLAVGQTNFGNQFVAQHRPTLPKSIWSGQIRDVTIDIAIASEHFLQQRLVVVLQPRLAIPSNWKIETGTRAAAKGRETLQGDSDVDHRGRLHAGMSGDRGRYLAGPTTCASSAGSDGNRARTTGSDCCRQRAGVSRPRTGSLELRNVGCGWSSFSRASRCRMPTSKASTDGCVTNSERELVHQFKRRTAKNRNLAEGLQRTTPTQFLELLAAHRVCTDSNGDASMRKASTRLPEQGTQTPSPAPDLIPAEPKINRELTLGLVQQTGALQNDTER